MARVPRTPPPAELPFPDVSLTPQELVRYSRHIGLAELGEDGQRRLKRASVLIVGAGGLGSPAALYLAAAGVGRIGVADFDTVDLTNLQRQLLHDTERVGQRKTDSARARLGAINPLVRVETIDDDTTREPLTPRWVRQHDAAFQAVPLDFGADGARIDAAKVRAFGRDVRLDSCHSLTEHVHADGLDGVFASSKRRDDNGHRCLAGSERDVFPSAGREGDREYRCRCFQQCGNRCKCAVRASRSGWKSDRVEWHCQHSGTWPARAVCG